MTNAHRHPPEGREPIHADPYPPELVPIQRVRRMRDAETRAEFRSGRGVTLFTLFSWLVAVVAIVAVVALLAATPRSTPDPTVAIPTNAQPTGARTDLPSQGSDTSGPESSGAPLSGKPEGITGAPISALQSGTATWCAPTPTHCQSWGGGAMKGAVQSFTYGDRPYRVTVCLQDDPGRCTRVTVVSHCACGITLIDLSPAAFDDLAPLSRGRIRVTVETGGAGPRGTLPPTGTEP